MYTGVRNKVTIIPWDWPLCSTGSDTLESMVLKISQCLWALGHPVGPWVPPQLKRRAPSTVCVPSPSIPSQGTDPLSSPVLFLFYLLTLLWLPSFIALLKFNLKVVFIFLYTVHPSRRAHWKAFTQAGWSKSASVPSLSTAFSSLWIVWPAPSSIFLFSCYS